MNRYPIEIHGIYTAPDHKVFGQRGGNLDGADLRSHSTINLIADSGIEGDRFCRHRPDYNGHVTFFSLEVWQALAKALSLPDSMGPEVTRRNLIVSGVDLKALYGVPFRIQGVHFLGATHCAPCLAMNRVLGPGAREALRSRGGLRAQNASSRPYSIGYGY